ncbi:unnamed protein product [Miscanthus lutarioriparius]|uniref:Uncharacterized protein n=1 Tax=Miscanthus lutarioriparius TaxID=422564 RepID=A0A811MG59_9POAL|nr:unnamed protein product [Miscanthus lutarioriparius]
MPACAAGGAEAVLLGKGRYKVWALAAIALLALWSMSAASVSLRWSSSGDLASVYGDLDVPLAEDLDSLEAFEAAYKELAGDDVQVRDAAISEIARMSTHKLELKQTLNENEVASGDSRNRIAMM